MSQLIGKIMAVIAEIESELDGLAHPNPGPIDADLIRSVKAIGYERIRELLERKEAE